MLRNYLIIAARSLLRQKAYTAISVAGLGIGMAFCLLAFRHLQYEHGYDEFHEDADRVFLLRFRNEQGGTWGPWTITPPPLAAALRENLAGIDQIVRLKEEPWSGVASIRVGEEVLRRSGVAADPGAFEVFSFPEVAGNPQVSLTDPGSVVISDEIARTLFGEDDPLEQRVLMDVGRGWEEYVVGAVIRVPENSSVQVDFVLSLREETVAADWGAWQVYTFLRLAPGVDPADFEALATGFLPGHYQATGVPLGEGPLYPVHLMPVRDLHLAHDHSYQLAETSNPLYAQLLAWAAVAVLLVASVNFTNLAIGTASTRAREVGVRKTMGSTRLRLMRQFWGEALLLAGVALALAVALAEMLLPSFNSLVQRRMDLDLASHWQLAAGIVTIVGLVAGAYPAAVMSAFSPTAILRRRLRIEGNTWFCRALLVFQFAISIGLIAAALFVSQQLDFLRSRDLGFDEEQVIVVDAECSDLTRARYHALLQQEAETGDRLVQVCVTNMLYGAGHKGFDPSPGFQGSGVTLDDGRVIHGMRFHVDHGFISTMGLDLAAGREFSHDLATDATESVLVNEAFLEVLGLDDVVGQSPPMHAAQRMLRGRRVIGVVGDFQVERVQQAIGPAAIHLRLPEQELDPDFSGDGRLRYVVARMRPEDVRGTVELLKSTWEEVAPDQPFLYTFLDENVERSLREEVRWMTASRWMAGLVIFIACLGVLGLSAMAAERRTKEIGVRKVLGASVPSLLSLLAREFTWLVVAASILAWPAAHYGLSRWLEGYAYRADLSATVFLGGGVAALVVVWLTASWQIARAALANPIEALRYE